MPSHAALSVESCNGGWHRAPQIADLGEEGRESWRELELKLVADVGIIGVPNAGKSTLLSVITAGWTCTHQSSSCCCSADQPYLLHLQQLRFVSSHTFYCAVPVALAHIASCHTALLYPQCEHLGLTEECNQLHCSHSCGEVCCVYASYPCVF